MVYLYNLLLIPLYYALIAASFPDLKKRNKAFAIVVCLHATLFRALANPFNYVDTDLYADGFVAISQMSFQDAILSINYYTHWGQGFLLFNWLVGLITQDYTLMFFLASFLAVIPVIWYYYKTSKNLLLPVLLYLTYPMMYYMGFGVLREHLAVPFVLLALYYVDNLKVSIPFAIIAVLFHTSAIIFFPYYFWRRINFSSKNKVKLIIFIALLVLLMRVSMGYVLSFMPKYDEIVGSKEIQNNYIPVLLFGIISFFIATLDVRKISKRDVDIQSFIYYGLSVSLFSVGLAGLGRLTIYFLYVMPLAISMYLAYSRKQAGKIILIISILLIYIRQIYYFLEVKDMNYTFFWE